MFRKNLVPILSLIFLGVSSRFIPHPPNFTAINAIALLGFSAFGSLRLTLGVLVAMMGLSDFFIGFYGILPFVYLSYGLIAFMGYLLTPKRPNTATIALSSLVFFLITNFGVWLNSSLFPGSLEGLGLCYAAALPFLATQFLGDFFYCVLIQKIFEFFGNYELFRFWQKSA